VASEPPHDDAERAPLRRLPRRASLAQEAHDSIRRDLLSGAWPRGEVLLEQGLAERLRMSRTPVREALHRLALAGMIEPAPGGGYVRRGSTPRDIREHCELRLLLEPQAAALAAGGDGAGLAAALERALAAEPGPDPVRNMRLHTGIADASGNDVLAGLIRTINERVAVHHLHAGRDAAYDAGHRAILAALRQGDPEAAAAAMREHLESVERALLEQVRRDRRPIDA
jgi:DNA-binding GntR family transcriptional regulator